MLGNIVYHIGKKGYTEIKTTLMMNGEIERDHEDKVSAFLVELREKDMKNLKNSGFDVYRGYQKLMSYSIDLTESSSNIKSITLISTIHEKEYNDKYWSDWYKKSF